MAYIRPCNKCGQRISMREMRAGQWVAFDASTEQPHKCGKKNKADPKITKLAKEKSKIKKNDSEGIDLGYDDVSQGSNIEESFSTNSTINKRIDEAIKNKNRVFIDYNSEFNQEITSREISPIKKFKYKNRNYIQAYCHLRKDQRSFLIRSIQNLVPLDKSRFKPKNLKNPNIAEFAEKFNELSNEAIENEYHENVSIKEADTSKVEIKKEYNNSSLIENKSGFFSSWLWYLMLAVWGFGILNYMLGCPFASCD